MRVLDLGCSDGWCLANLAAADLGYDGFYGVEFNPDAAKRARERGLPGEIIAGDIFSAPSYFKPHSFDLVYCFEVIEHVPDPEALISTMERMVCPGGRCLLSTPDGAFERGNVPEWFRVEHKGHLRAIPPRQLAGWLCSRGILEDFIIGPDRVQVAAWTPSPRKGKIVFYAGSAEALPEKILAEGLGGSETALCKLAEHFARSGYDVRVYAGTVDSGPRSDLVSTGDGESAPRGQVLYAPHTAWDPGEKADLFISSRIPEVFDRRIAAKQRWLWLHDAEYGDRLTEERAKRADKVLVMSEFQRELLAKRYPFVSNWEVTRNGIETTFFAEPTPWEKREPLVVYSSSPDRGLDVLLECWPEVKAQVPEARLLHTYAPYYHQAREMFPHLAEFHRKIEALSKTEGVESLGSTGQKDLAELYSRAKVWAYPSWTTPSADAFPEISCISAMEAQAGGARPVCLDYGALTETVKAPRIPLARHNGSLSPKWRARFVAEIVEGLNGSGPDPAWREWALTQDWSGVAEEWIAQIS